ncbi:hypothetical protein V9K67_23850 [Paraflavisolibacter sp. H34]|uniref:hypothetical protein n=1 Tax=Huijunlia imazamoxiresistens TaxID=3127457 RepID=UPI0030169B02
MFHTNRRIFFAGFLLFGLILLFSQCMQKKRAGTDPRGSAFAGAAACARCHKDIHTSYLDAAHNKTSAIASKSAIGGSFAAPHNEYVYRPGVKVAMEERDSALYQVAYSQGQEQQASRFDIVVGSGRKAQTFLYWYDDKVFQLPVSYFVPAHSWANSPNYPPRQVRFDRNIPIGCFECHSSYIKRTTMEPAGEFYIDHFDRQKIVYGIDCERCHGPAARHVDYHEEHPQEKQAKFIKTYASLSRQMKLDGCAVCHSGLQATRRSTFAFRPGDTLANRFFPPAAPVNVADIDVHGNQYQLLTASQCFIKSKTMDCATCHDPHVKERDNLAAFSQRCMTCHSEAAHNFCKMAPALGASITQNCIDCHMPARPSKLITLLSNGQASPTPNKVRTHYISVYPETSPRSH